MIKKVIFAVITLTTLVLMVGCGSDTSETQIEDTSTQNFEQEIGGEQREGSGRRGGQDKLDRIQQGGGRRGQ